MDQYGVAVIGAGPAGLFCALHAAAAGIPVILLEKNRGPGKKLLLSGSGQCNLTHAGEIREFLTHYGSHGKFLKPALLSFTNNDLVTFFRSRGLDTVTQEGGKIFPATLNAEDILDRLVSACRENGAVIRYGEPVTGISRANGGFIVTAAGNLYRAENLVIATGGMSYPATGSTGDGYRLAASLGQPVTPVAPALTPVSIRNYPFFGLAGISFAGAGFTLWRNGKKAGEYAGDILLTHAGLSGPGILDASRDFLPGDELRVSFTGGRGEEGAQRIGMCLKEADGGRLVRSALASFPLPDRFVRTILSLADVPPDLTCAHLPAALRNRLATFLGACPLVIESTGDFRVAMATRGGVALDGVDAKTLESRTVPGLYFCGEVLDIDGDTGGYNLQAAFSTGVLAARSIARKVQEIRA